MKKRLSTALAAMAAFSLLASACSGTAQNTPADTGDSTAEQPSSTVLQQGVVPSAEEIMIPDGQTIKVGFLGMNQTDIFCVLVEEAIRDEASKFGAQVELLVSDGQGIAATQIAQAEDMLVKDVDVIILNATDKDACAPILDKTQAADTPVILLNSVLSNMELATSYVGVNDEEAGVTAMQIIGEALGGKGTINVLQGQLGNPANEYRITGLQQEREANYPDIVIGATQAADWDRNKAMNVTEDWISSGNPFDAIIALNDEMAISASNALQAAGLTDVLVVGVDALDEALSLIAEGKMYGTVSQNPEKLGRSGLDVAICAALDLPVDKEYIMSFEPVTPDNLSDYM